MQASDVVTQDLPFWLKPERLALKANPIPVVP
jgi:hypothetical protein